MENKIIELLGIERWTESKSMFKNEIIQVLKDIMNRRGISEQIDGEDIYEQYAEQYILKWILKNEERINELCQEKADGFTQKKISEYIEKHPVYNQKYDEILTIDLKKFFGGELTPEEEKKLITPKEEYTHYLSEEQALTEMKNQLEQRIKNLLSMEEFVNGLKKININNVTITKDPEDFFKSNSINKQIMKRIILRGNSGVIMQDDTKENIERYDFDTNEKQITIVHWGKLPPILIVYIPDKEYPKGLMCSTFLKQREERIQECYRQLRDLYKKFNRDVDFDSLIAQIKQQDMHSQSL